LTAALWVATVIAAVPRVTAELKSICPVAAPLPTVPFKVMPPGAVKLIGPARPKPVTGRLKVCAVTVNAVKFEVVPIWSSPTTVPAPPASALRMRFCAPLTAPVNVSALPLDRTLTGPPTSARPPLKVMPS